MNTKGIKQFLMDAKAISPAIATLILIVIAAVADKNIIAGRNSGFECIGNDNNQRQYYSITHNTIGSPGIY